MKYLLIILISLLGISMRAIPQVVNQIIISPSNPGPNDTINVISNFTYNGNCSFGLVYSNSYLVGTDILIYATYCGYWDTTLCNSIDTFKIGPFPNGSYSVHIEYHQGSVCPISGFDATIAQFDTSLTVTATSAIPYIYDPGLNFTIYPLPGNNNIVIDLGNYSLAGIRLRVTNMLGQTILQKPITQTQTLVDLTGWSKGMYFYEIIDQNALRRKTKVWLH